MIGFNNRGNITNGYAMGNVSGNFEVGGFIGNNSGAIINSYAMGDVSGESALGGLIGNNSGGITNSYYETGTVSGSSNNIGGLVGENYAAISDTYAVANVSGNNNVGGLIGFNQEDISNSYAAVRLSATQPNVGRLVGSQSAGNVKDSYWDNQRSGVDKSASGTSATTVELQGTDIEEGIYENWSKTNWYSGTDADYPILRYIAGDDDDDGGDFLGPVRLTQLQTLTVSQVDEPTENLLLDFDPQKQSYIINLLPGVAQLIFRWLPFSDNVTVQVDGNPIVGTSTIVNLSFNQNQDYILTTVATGASTATYTVTIYRVGLCSTSDIDKDNDGLIEICSPIGLNAIRYQLDGRGYKANADADTPIFTEGCYYQNTGVCIGYELERDLKNINTSFRNWDPIGNDITPFNAVFDGNGHIISDLVINRPSNNYVGLFGYTAQNSTITSVGLLDIKEGQIEGIIGHEYVGGLVGRNDGVIANSYVNSDIGIVANFFVSDSNDNIGGLVGDNTGTITNSYAAIPVMGAHNNIGGLVGSNTGNIKNSYSTGTVNGNSRVGGLVGRLGNGGRIENSYAAIGAVSGNDSLGGLVGFAADPADPEPIVVNSYWDLITSGQTSSGGGMSQSTAELQGAIIEAAGIYQNWSNNDWFSGLSTNYPILKYTKLSDSIPACGQPGQPICDSLLGGQICGSDEQPCDVLLPGDFVPLSRLVLLSGGTNPNREEDLEPAFEPNRYTYRAIVSAHAENIQFMIAVSTTRTVSYQIDSGAFITLALENGVGTQPVALPPSPIPISMDTTRTVIIRVGSPETRTNPDANDYTIEVGRRSAVFVELKLLLEGALNP